jgi:hypothetical protein
MYLKKAKTFYTLKMIELVTKNCVVTIYSLWSLDLQHLARQKHLIFWLWYECLVRCVYVLVKSLQITWLLKSWYHLMVTVYLTPRPELRTIRSRINRCDQPCFYVISSLAPHAFAISTCPTSTHRHQPSTSLAMSLVLMDPAYKLLYHPSLLSCYPIP